MVVTLVFIYLLLFCLVKSVLFSLGVLLPVGEILIDRTFCFGPVYIVEDGVGFSRRKTSVTIQGQKKKRRNKGYPRRFHPV